MLWPRQRCCHGADSELNGFGFANKVQLIQWIRIHSLALAKDRNADWAVRKVKMEPKQKFLATVHEAV